MDKALAWATFLGTWLLVAGPVYQAVIELGDEEFEADRLHAAARTVPQPEPVSRWWWLIPPVRFWLRNRRTEAYKNAVVEALSDQDAEQLAHFMNKAMGWTIVGSGAFLLALSETWALREEWEWPVWTFAALMLVMCALVIAFAARRERSTHQALARHHAHGAGG